MKKLSICLIVGNERDHIVSCIKSFSKIADEFVVVRAVGNQLPDETVAIARNLSSLAGIPWKESEYLNSYETREWPHVDNFAEARQQSFNLASGDWCMWVDADDVLPETEENYRLFQNLKNGDYEAFTSIYLTYQIPEVGGYLYRERIAKKSAKPNWVNPVHEAFDTDNNKRMYSPDPNVYILHAPKKDKKGSVERNLRILEYASKHPDLYPDNKIIAFYLHRELMQVGRIKEAIEAAEKALELGLGEIEHYETQMNLAGMYLDEGKASLARAVAHGAINTMPWRREAFALLAQIELKEKNYQKMLGYTMAMRGIDEPKGIARPWSQRDNCYGWYGAFLHHQALRLTGNIAQAEREEENVFQMEGSKITVIHPTMCRGDLAIKTYNQWMGSASNPGAIQYIFAIDKVDDYTRHVLRGLRYIICPHGAREAVEHAKKFATGKRVVVIDDYREPIPNWDLLPDEELPKPHIEWKIEAPYEGYPKIISKEARKYVICGKEGKSDNPDYQPQHCHFELGWEVNTSHVWAKYLLSRGKLTRDDIIVTLPGREFLYNTCFDRVITWNGYCEETGKAVGKPYPEVSNEYTLDLVRYFERNWHRYPTLYFEGQGKTWGGGAWDLIQSVAAPAFGSMEGRSFLLMSLRKRPHESRRDTSDSFGSELLKKLRSEFNLPIYLVGLNLPDFGVEGVSGCTLQEFAYLARQPECRGILGPHSGPNGLAGLLAPKDTKIIIFPMEFCPSINGNYPTGMGKCVNLNGNIRHWLPVGASPDDIVAKAKEVL